MKVTCSRAALFEAVQLAASITPQRTPKPILQCAKLEADADEKKLTIIATDNEITIRYVVAQVTVAEGGAAVLSAARLTGILRESSEETIDLETDDGTCTISGKDSKFHIYGHDPDDFPEIASPETGPDFKVNAGQLRRMIAMSSFAAARENTRYAINGVLWEQNGKKLHLVATDGRRLAKIIGEAAPGDKEHNQTGIVPVKTMNVLDRLLADPEEKITVAFSSNQVFITTALAQLCGNLMQGRFPKYQDVIPSGADKKVTIDCATLQSAVRRAALLINEQSKGIELAFSKDQLRLSSSAPEAGDAEITMPVEYTYDELKIGFNPTYLLEMLRVADVEQVDFEFSDAAKPGLARVGNDFLYVVMPVTV